MQFKTATTTTTSLRHTFMSHLQNISEHKKNVVLRKKWVFI